MFEKAINQNLLRLMVGHKNSLVQGISKFNKINGAVSNLFKTNRVKSRRLKFLKECFLSCLCAAPSQLLEKHPWNSCWLQCVTWFMARNTEGETTAYQKEGKNENEKGRVTWTLGSPVMLLAGCQLSSPWRLGIGSSEVRFTWSELHLILVPPKNAAIIITLQSAL